MRALLWHISFRRTSVSLTPRSWTSERNWNYISNYAHSSAIARRYQWWLQHWRMEVRRCYFYILILFIWGRLLTISILSPLVDKTNVWLLKLEFECPIRALVLQAWIPSHTSVACLLRHVEMLSPLCFHVGCTIFRDDSPFRFVSFTFAMFGHCFISILSCSFAIFGKKCSSTGGAPSEVRSLWSNYGCDSLSTWNEYLLPTAWSNGKFNKRSRFLQEFY